jgi:two-component system, OmpR family, response regulator MprA
MSTPRPLAGISVLLVDDDPDGREVLEYSLSHAGATVMTAAGARDALERFKASPPTVVVTDIAMPMLDGIWLCEQIRALGIGTPRVPIIALTALVYRNDRDRIRAAGFDAHLVKPYGLDDLQQVIRVLTARR